MMTASDWYKWLNSHPGQIVTTNKQENILHLIAVLKTNWQCNKALNWPIFMLTLPKDCLSRPAQQNWCCHSTETSPGRSPPDFPDTFQGASYLTCHRFGHDRTTAEPSRGQGDFKQPLARTEKPFASGKLSYTL